MILDKSEIEFIKANQTIITAIITKRLNDTVNEMIDNTDPEKGESLRRWAKEMRQLLNVVSGISKNPEQEDEKQFTGL